MTKNYILFSLPEESTLDLFDSHFIKIITSNYYFVFTPKSKTEFNLILDLVKNKFTFSLEDLDIDVKIDIIGQLFPQGMFKITQFIDTTIVCEVDIKVPIDKKFAIKAQFKNQFTNHFLKIADTSFLLASRESPHEIYISQDGIKYLQDFILKLKLNILDETVRLFKVVLDNFIEAYENNDDINAQTYWADHDRFFLNQTRVKSLFQKKPIGATFPFSQPKRIPFNFSNIGQVNLEKDGNLKLPCIFKKRESRKIGTGENNITAKELANFLQLLMGKTQRNFRDEDHFIYPIPGNINSHELLILNNGCNDFPRGIYLFDQQDFSLKKVNNDGIDLYMKIYTQVWGQGSEPQMVIQVLKHYPSLAWKYSSINLRVMLIEAGGILQSAQLLAAELNLVVCPLGTGPNISIEGREKDFFEWIPTLEFTLEKDNGSL